LRARHSDHVGNDAAIIRSTVGKRTTEDSD
jgi:hypothetical protein